MYYTLNTFLSRGYKPAYFFGGGGFLRCGSGSGFRWIMVVVVVMVVRKCCQLGVLSFSSSSSSYSSSSCSLIVLFNYHHCISFSFPILLLYFFVFVVFIIGKEPALAIYHPVSQSVILSVELLVHECRVVVGGGPGRHGSRGRRTVRRGLVWPLNDLVGGDSRGRLGWRWCVRGR